MAALSLRTIEYATRWNDRSALYEYLIDRDPTNVRLITLKVVDLLRDGRNVEAREWAARGTSVAPGYYDIWLFAARAEMELGNFDEAGRMIEIAHRIWPNPRTSGYQSLLGEMRQNAKGKHTPATQPSIDSTER